MIRLSTSAFTKYEVVLSLHHDVLKLCLDDCGMRRIAETVFHWRPSERSIKGCVAWLDGDCPRGWKCQLR